MKLKAIKTLLSIFVISLFTFSCEDFLEEEPVTILSPTSLLSDTDGASIVMIGAYDILTAFWGQRSLVTFTNCHSDMLQSFASWGPISDFDQPLNSTNISRSERVWEKCYEAINITNTVIAQVENMDVQSAKETEKNELIGEAKFIRALSYYYLVRLYGPVPIRTQMISTPDEAEEGVARSPVNDVYNQVIIPDLEAASQNCKDEWSNHLTGRATKWAAKLLLAEVNLTIENWSEAASLAQEVIGSGKFSLVPVNQADDFMKIYGPNVEKHSEEIFSFKFTNVIEKIGNWEAQFANGWNGGLYTTGNSGWTGYNANYTNPLIINWSDDDLRKEFSTYFEVPLADGTIREVGYTIRGVKHAHVRKWRDNVAPGTTNGGNDIPVVRLADAYLIHAEASAMASGGTPSADAMESLNKVRRRAYGYDINTASPVDYTGGGNFREEALKERAYEFFAEAKRWYDLKRTNTVAQAIETAFPGLTFNPVRLLYPLPPAEIQNNEALSDADQNPGY